MAWTKYQLFLAGLMLVTGSINTLSAKWADNFKAEGCGGSEEHSFQHPFLQAVGMFLGEFSCLAAFYLLQCRATGQSDSGVDPQQPFNPLLFLPPALCDMTGTSIMYVALNMTSASSFQMLRGAVIIFTGLFSVAFLGRRLAPSQWLGILATIAGLVVVGLADLLSKHDSQHKLSEVITGAALWGPGAAHPVLWWPVLLGSPARSRPSDYTSSATCSSWVRAHACHRGLGERRGDWRGACLRQGVASCVSSAGDLLIIMAQVIVAIQMVLEEKFVYKHNVHPLRAVGTEGLFGFVILSLLLVPMYFIPAGSFSGNPRGTLEDALDAFCQVGRQPLIALALLGNISSIAFFNFAGISVTKELSATTRMVLDSLRTVVIWALSLALGWEDFHPLQILGFFILLMGTALYNGLHRPLLACLSRCWRPAQDSERERLLGGSRTPINEAS